MSDKPTYSVTFVFVDGTTHTLRNPKTLAQIAQYQDTLDARLHPRPPREDPDELPLDDNGNPVRPVDRATLRFDFGDQGLIVPASQISHIRWTKT